MDIGHSVRNGLADRERTWLIGDEAVFWKDAKKEGSIEYKDISRIRLVRYAAFGSEDQFQTTLSVRGQGKFKIRSHHYEGIGNFKDRRALYTPFVRALVARVASHSPEAEFIAGSRVYQIIWIMLLAAFVVLAILLVMALFGGMEASLRNIGLIVALVVSLPFIWRQILKNRSFRFDPANPPGDLTGDEAIAAS